MHIPKTTGGTFAPLISLNDDDDDDDDSMITIYNTAVTASEILEKERHRKKAQHNQIFS